MDGELTGWLDGYQKCKPKEPRKEDCCKWIFVILSKKVFKCHSNLITMHPGGCVGEQVFGIIHCICSLRLKNWIFPTGQNENYEKLTILNAGGNNILSISELSLITSILNILRKFYLPQTSSMNMCGYTLIHQLPQKENIQIILLSGDNLLPLWP